MKSTDYCVLVQIANIQRQLSERERDITHIIFWSNNVLIICCRCYVHMIVSYVSVIYNNKFLLILIWEEFFEICMYIKLLQCIRSKIKTISIQKSNRKTHRTCLQTRMRV